MDKVRKQPDKTKVREATLRLDAYRQSKIAEINAMSSNLALEVTRKLQELYKEIYDDENISKASRYQIHGMNPV